jgi:hypothetical protein
MTRLFGQMVDERSRENSRYAAAIMLGVTQVLLAVAVFVRLYVHGQPDAEIADFRAVLAISVFGFVILQLLLGGVLPKPTPKGALVAYLLLAGLVTGGCLIIYGIPPAVEWKSTWLPALLGPALFVGIYWITAIAGDAWVNARIGRD